MNQGVCLSEYMGRHCEGKHSTPRVAYLASVFINLASAPANLVSVLDTWAPVVLYLLGSAWLKRAGTPF